MNRENLQKLADYLLIVSPDKFDMTAFTDNEQDFAGRTMTSCGTVGCAIGHGPNAGFEKNLGESWVEYSERLFELNKYEWSWCFGEEWADIDNSPIGASQRINTLLNIGLPYNWHEQMRPDLYDEDYEGNND